MIILASEDVGMADPHALETVIACAEAFDRIGLPEGRFPLAQACLYLATAPKSNTTLSFFDALKEVENEDAEVPNQLRDSSRDAEGFGHGEGYIYPHAYRDHWAAQQYLPSALVGRIFYTPSSVGYESRIRDDVLHKREIQAAVILGDSAPHDDAADGEILSWSAAAKGREGWFKRMESGRSALLLADRDLILEQNRINRYDRILVAAANDGLLLWEALRLCPEGLAAALVDTAEAQDALMRFTAVLDETDKPMIAVLPGGKIPDRQEAETAFSCSSFDHFLAREPWKKFRGDPAGIFSQFASSAKEILAPGGNVVLLQSIPKMGERISRILLDECGALSSLADELRSAEEIFFNNPEAGRTGSMQAVSWDCRTVEESFTAQGFVTEIQILDRQEERMITNRDLENWFNTERSAWGSFIFKKLGPETVKSIRSFLNERTARGPLLWKWKSLLLNGSSGTKNITDK